MLQPSDILVRDCPACGGATDHEHLYVKNGCDILRCAVCGIGRTETSGFDPSAYYTGDYFAGGHADGYVDYLGAEPVLRREFSHVLEFVRRYRTGGRLLELGCAYGFFLQEARRCFDVVGIELAQNAAEHARKSGLRVVTGIADEDTLRELGTFDVVVLLDVIEHLPNPHETLALCARHLNPGGIIVLTTGDFGSPLARLWGAGWRLMTPPQHLWFFTAESMWRLGARLDLTIERIDHPWKIVPLSLILFQLKRTLRIGSASARVLGRVGIPANLFDAMRLVMRKPQ